MINNVSKFNSILQGNRLILRQILPTELEEKYIDWMNDPELVQYMESRFHIYSRFDLEKYVNHINEDGSSIMWGIYESDTLEYIGNIKLGSIDWNHRFGDIGLIIGERKSWGKGYATESILLVCDFGFHKLSLNKITAGIYENNIGSKKAFIKAGFYYDGRLTSQYKHKGIYIDKLILGKFNSKTRL